MNRNENDPARLDASQDHNPHEPQQPKRERPWWQTEGCPSWCVAGYHQPTDDPADRMHYSGADLREEGRILLTLASPQHHRDGTVYEEPPFLDSYLAQQWREAEPRIVLSVNEGPGMNLTLSEARQLQEVLQQLLRASGRG